MRLIEATNLNYRDLVDGFLECKTVEEVFPKISRDMPLSRAYLNRLKAVFTNPAYQDWSEPQPLRNKRLKKEIVDAWVEDLAQSEKWQMFRNSIIREIIPQVAAFVMRRTLRDPARSHALSHPDEKGVALVATSRIANPAKRASGSRSAVFAGGGMFPV
jgi:hypothetical protein